VKSTFVRPRRRLRPDVRLPGQDLRPAVVGSALRGRFLPPREALLRCDSRRTLARALRPLFTFSSATFFLCRLGGAQSLTIEEYEPKSTLVVPAHRITRAKFPFIDVHNHQDTDLSAADADALVREMDTLNMRLMVNLSGGSGEELARGVRNLKGRHPKRFAVFANVDFAGIGEAGWGERAAAQLARDVHDGARGLKIYKSLGLTLKDSRGERVPVDDSRIDPVWRKCGELGIPVLIHTAEPASFFQPYDRFNERWLELKQFPQRARPPDRFPPWEQLLAEQHRLFARHPKTKFINAHLGWLGGDLGRLGKLLDSLPNVFTEIGAVLAELGRQPRFARKWFLRYQNRVMFGKDTWAPEEYHVYFRTLETADEYFDYYRKRHAHWKIYGLDLPDEVLKKLYYKNALRVIPGIDPAGFPG
jgi:predicted TIM-barrel fold metal-dependent hydrolase